MIESGAFIGLVAPFKTMLSVTEFLGNILKNALKIKEKISDAVKTIDTSIKVLKKLLEQE